MNSEAAPARAVSPDDHLVFTPTIEELFVRLLGAQLTPDIRRELREVGLDIDAKLLPAYPVRVLDAAMDVVVRRVFSHLPREVAFAKLGEMQLDAFAQTLLGRAAFQFMRLLSVERFLDRLTRGWRNANNFMEARVTRVEPDVFDVWVNDVGQYPEVIGAIMRRALERLGNEVQVSVASTKGLECTYRLKVTKRSK
ncbi:MAG: DUF2378 family protein [Deltaproteobacteria bacterium]|nr:DUF2378 family protein [Deltaproteobacteria bacterium]